MTGAVRGIAQSFGPVLAGLAIGAASFGLPFFAGGGLKIIYDLALFAGFRNRRAAHEPLPRASPASSPPSGEEHRPGS